MVGVFSHHLPFIQINLDLHSEGKYMGYAQRHKIVGCDRSKNLVSICASQGFEVAVCDNMVLPYRSGAFDVALSIAVLHHFSSRARRRHAISEILRIIRVGGQAIVYAWALEQGEESRRSFPSQDILVPWHHQRNEADANSDNGPTTESAATTSNSDVFQR
eukprot:m.449214 g.449214  ORF g.449214 m.449214 type:complete len:161 (+) comp56900_c0_seq2:958-1440(+)